MRRGKEIAQGAHASMKFLSDGLEKTNTDNFNITLTKEEQLWLEGSFAKICLQVNSEAELLEIHQKAEAAGLTSNLIQDSGKTEFGGKPTYTCLAIGPACSDKIDPITEHLQLY